MVVVVVLKSVTGIDSFLACKEIGEIFASRSSGGDSFYLSHSWGSAAGDALPRGSSLSRYQSSSKRERGIDLAPAVSTHRLQLKE